MILCSQGGFLEWSCEGVARHGIRRARRGSWRVCGSSPAFQGWRVGVGNEVSVSDV
jgi:hypothetical protein